MADSPEKKQNESSGESTIRNSPPGTKRLILTLCVLFSFILGFPLLLKSTEIYRSSLPFRSIDSFSRRLDRDPLLLPCHFRAVFIGFDWLGVGYKGLENTISEEIVKCTGGNLRNSGCSGDESVEVIIDSVHGCLQISAVGNGSSWVCGLQDSVFSRFDVDSGDDDDRIDDALESLHAGICVDGCYNVFVIRGGEENVKTVVGKYRHAWIVGKPTEPEAVSLAGRVFGNFFVNGGREDPSFQKAGESMPVAADGSVVLSFSLLNSNPNDWIYDWDFQKIEDIFLSPVSKRLAPIINISVESQVLYHTPRASYSYWDEKSSSYISRTKDLPFFVQSLPSMIIMDEIGTQVKLSLEASTAAQSIASRGMYDAVALFSLKARALAEDAFFHPSNMSLLYFPIEHHIAIYMPFFVPVLMHVLVATFREVKRYR